ncbi:MAG: DNA polymerase III subunit epsilon, partial [Bacteroidetes bacterium]
DKNGITEIAIFIHNGKKVTEKFVTLINPEMSIPPFLEHYTGITNQMVENAPVFSEVAEKIHQLLQPHIFVAHNVNFDYSFIKHHLQQAGYDLNTKKLCTVRLSRKVFPGLRSYSLGNLCVSLNINLQHRHRAFGDAAATVKVLERILKKDENGEVINSFLKKGSKEATLPPNLPRQEFDALPTKPGVYYFHNEQGKILYVGKAVNLKKRVLSHFSNNSTSAKRQDFLRDIFHISFTVTATELHALIHESIEIKKHWPKYNKSLKSLEFSYGIYDYEDQNGYVRLAIDRTRKSMKPLHTYRKLADAFNHLQKLVLEFNLCPKLCLINAPKEPCAALVAGCCNGACELNEKPEMYNGRAFAAINELSKKENYAVIDKGINDDEISCMLVIESCFYGIAQLPEHTAINNLEDLKQLVTPLKDNFYIRELIQNHKIKGRIITFD